jgi:hypothetical protein
MKTIYGRSEVIRSCLVLTVDIYILSEHVTKSRIGNNSFLGHFFVGAEHLLEHVLQVRDNHLQAYGIVAAIVLHNTIQQ